MELVLRGSTEFLFDDVTDINMWRLNPYTLKVVSCSNLGLYHPMYSTIISSISGCIFVNDVTLLFE